jgi:hypothetical protein
LYTKIGGVDILVGGAYIRLFRSGKRLNTYPPRRLRFRQDQFLDAKSGFALYNITAGITTTDLAGWFER